MRHSTSSTNGFFDDPPLHNHEDFSRFYDHYAPILYGQLRLNNELQQATFLLEQTFITFWHRRDEFNESHAQLSTPHTLVWLLTIVHELS